ncbi:MAG: glycosyltransferase [candidate division KSB1 bacterium]|nr:glycosyltransferase [candidate division KSB1 bacterium]MDZ7301661.1 glycosyltransferase [candidate division KSB1 bacterium]MDZ7313478.1 glycosyltransferase [candidate division KSB1 bacterium]
MSIYGSIKILHVIHSLHTGGAEQVVKNYALQRDRSRFHVAVCALTGGGDIVTELRSAGITVYLLGKSGRWDLRVLPGLAATIRAEAPDLIHVHDDMSNNWTALALGWRRHVPVVRTIHKIYEPDSSPYFRAHQLLSRRLYRSNAYLICCSEAVRQSLQLNASFNERLVTIHNGIDLRQFSPPLVRGAATMVLDQTAGNVVAAFRIGTIASLRAEKGHEYLLRAAQILKQMALPVHIYLVGDGDRRTHLEQLAQQLEVQNIVHFLGPRCDVREVLEEFDLVVFPSITEGLPMAMLEALAMKKPVIASAVGGIPEVIQPGETGWLVPPADSSALASAIAYALQHPEERQAVAEQGFHKVASEFTVAIMTRRTEQIYEKALAQRERGGSAKGIGSCNDLRILFMTMFPNPEKRVPPNQTALLADHLERTGARVLRTTRETRRVFKTLRFITALLQYVRAYDIVQIQTTPSVGFINTAVVIGLGKLLGKKVVSNYFTSAGPEFLERFRRVTVPILKRADGIVVASSYVRDKLQALGLQVSSIPHLLDCQHWRFKPRRIFEPRLIWVKRFDPEAGPMIMLSAFQILKQHVPTAQLVMIGDGPLRHACQQFVQAQQLGDVEFPGFVPRENLQAFYDAADIFVLTSRNDNQPMAVLEAMACGLPVVATKVGGVPEMIDDRVSGLLIEADDYHILAETIRFLLQHQEQARQMVDAALRKLERYRWENVGKNWLDFYHKLFAERHEPGDLQRISQNHRQESHSG